MRKDEKLAPAVCLLLFHYLFKSNERLNWFPPKDVHLLFRCTHVTLRDSLKSQENES